MRLANKVALISGAARGIGLASAKLFAAEGAKVVIGDLREDEGRQAAGEIVAAGGIAEFVRLDVTSEADWPQAVAAAQAAYGALHILVNNAGVSPGGKSFEDTTLEDWRRVMDVNLTGVFLGMRAAIPALRAAGGGSIVNLSSMFGIVGSPTSSPHYQASKGGVRMLSKGAAVRYAPEGIRVNSVHPGIIITPMSEATRSDPDRVRAMEAQAPLGRYGTAEEVASGILYLASDEARYTTGIELVIDGGWTAK